MEFEPGEGWADAVSKILRMGTNNPESNRILSKAKKDKLREDDDNDQHSDSGNDSQNEKGDTIISEKGKNKRINTIDTYLTKRLKPNPQKDALLENELKDAATRGVVHLFNAVKTVNPKSDKRKKKKKKRKKRIKKRFRK